MQETLPPAPTGSKIVWLKSPFPARELDGQMVEFRIYVNREKYTSQLTGTGKFRALGNDQGFTRIEIVVTQQGRTCDELVDHIFYCQQRSANLIKRQPSGSNCAFSLFEFSDD